MCLDLLQTVRVQEGLKSQTQQVDTQGEERQYQVKRSSLIVVEWNLFSYQIELPESKQGQMRELLVLYSTGIPALADLREMYVRPASR